MALLPIPRNWARVRSPLAKLYTKASEGMAPSPDELFAKSLTAYDLREDDVSDLMVWAQE